MRAWVSLSLVEVAVGMIWLLCQRSSYLADPEAADQRATLKQFSTLDEQVKHDWETAPRTPAIGLYIPRLGSFPGHGIEPIVRNFELTDEAISADRLKIAELQLRLLKLEKQVNGKR